LSEWVFSTMTASFGDSYWCPVNFVKHITTNLAPKPVPGQLAPKPVPGRLAPKPVPGRLAPKPVPGQLAPKPVPGRLAPKPAPGQLAPKPVPGRLAPKPVPGRRRNATNDAHASRPEACTEPFDCAQDRPAEVTGLASKHIQPTTIIPAMAAHHQLG
jgi:hypothetical protein